MISANVAELKSKISEYIKSVTEGETVTVCIRNNPVAMITPLKTKKSRNMTQLGCGKGSVKVKHDLTEPAISPSDWNMLSE